MRRFCIWSTGIFFVLWILALAILLIGTFGLFGQEPDPVSAVFLIPLGLPWNRFIEFAPQDFWPWLVALAPGINLILLRFICNKLAKKEKAQ